MVFQVLYHYADSLNQLSLRFNHFNVGHQSHEPLNDRFSMGHKLVNLEFPFGDNSLQLSTRSYEDSLSLTFGELAFQKLMLCWIE